MSKAIRCSWMVLLFVSILTTIAVVGKPIYGQSAPAIRAGGVEVTGIPEDWSSRHVVFSNPGTEQEAIQKGEHDHWQNVVNDPRYVIQQLRKNLPIQGPAAVDAEYRSRWISDAAGDRMPNFARRKRFNLQSSLKRDWSKALGGPGLAAGHYPAKYSLSTSAVSCSDFVVFPTGALSSGTQATIVAFNSVYSGCPLYSGGPVVYWAIIAGTGETATTSPVVSQDGTQIAFVQTNGTTASLVLFKMGAGGTVASPNALTAQATGTLYSACTGPCYISFSLGANDTNSAPYIDYPSDQLFVGDDSGKLHEVTGAFRGTPALDPTGWPATASTTAEPALYSPVADIFTGRSGRIFVTDAAGYLHSVLAATPATVRTSGHLEQNTGHLFEPPLLDPVTEQVYTFIGYSGDTGNNNPSYINRFPAATNLGGVGAGAGSGTGTGVAMGNGSTSHTTNPATSFMRIGAFDNLYYEGTGTTGNLYVCENGNMYQVSLSTFTAAGVHVYSPLASTIDNTSACSPVTEFVSTKVVSGTPVATTLSAAITTTTGPTVIDVTSGTNIANTDFLRVDSEIMQVTSGGGTTALTVTRAQQGTTGATHSNGAAVQDVQDWLFTSVIANGSATGCTGACLYNFSVMGAGTTGTATAGLAATGGTSGIVIDSSSTAETGDEEIYYTLLGGTSAVQDSQAGLQ